MNTRFVTNCCAALIAAIVLVALAPVPVAAQSEHRTSWGDPDLQGVWDFRTLTPLERPAELADKEFLTAEEAAAFEAQTLEARDADRRDGADKPFGIGSDVERAYNQFWWDYGTNVTEDKRTSLIIDPADGTIPYTPAGRERAGEFFSVLFGNVAAGPEDRALGERCILGFNSGPPMLPSAYNNNVQLFQTPDTVVILNEMVHNARIVPLNGPPHIPADMRQWVGDSRGRWEGETLVVETTNFLGETGFVASGASLRLVERFTRADDDSLVYEFTVEDPTVWTRPWTAAVPMTKSDLTLFEYACHEGNYGMTNLLAGARVEEKKARAK